jgi:hypothetical protein
MLLSPSTDRRPTTRTDPTAFPYQKLVGLWVCGQHGRCPHIHSMGLWTLWVTGMLSISPQADTIVLGTSRPTDFSEDPKVSYPWEIL